MSDFQEMTNEALREEVIRAGDRVSMYEAAEGQSYQKEAALRLAAKAHYYAVVAECKRRGVDTTNPHGVML